MVTLETPVKVADAEPDADLDHTEVAHLFYWVPCPGVRLHLRLPASIGKEEQTLGQGRGRGEDRLRADRQSSTARRVTGGYCRVFTNSLG